MPPHLFFYINFGSILHTDGNTALTAARKPVRPHLRDLEWEIFYNWIEAKGFSGFEDDDEISCVKALKEHLDGEPDIILHASVYKKNGELKQYEPTRTYLRRLRNKPLGLPLYMNEALNLFNMGSRGLGKSYSTAGGMLLHDVLFDGAKYYNDDYLHNMPQASVFLGAGIAAKSSDLADKVEFNMENLPGVWAKNTPEEVPSPFYRVMAGNLNPNNMKNPWRYEYEEKLETGRWVKKGTRSSIRHGVYTTENPEAAAGGRYGTMVIEEVGLLPNVLTVHGSNTATMIEGIVKFGSAIYIGCVCAGTKVWTNDGHLKNIEDLQKEDGIVGYHSDGALQQNIEKFTEPKKKKCYRINFEGGDKLECSDDHPILISKHHFDKNIDKVKYRVCTFREAKNITDKDQIGIISEIPIFGKKKNKHARLLGLLVGDGYYGGSTAELSLDSDETIEYMENNYSCKTKKEFVTKKGYLYKSVNISGINDILREAGIKGQTKYKKQLPIDIDDYDKESLSEFIGGYFDADGSVKFGQNGKVQITLTSNLKHLLYGIKYRLIKFGIESNIYKERRSGGYEKGSEFKYVLYVNQFESVLKFADNIKFLTKRKQNKLIRIYAQSINKNGRSKLPLRYIAGEDGNFFEGATDVYDISFKKIKSIEDIGEQYVYNLTAGGSHSYLANNVITHNTGGNIEKVVESELIFRNPRGYQMMAFNDEWEGTGEIGFFIPAYYALNQFKDENGNTDEEKALAFLLKRRKALTKNTDVKALQLEMMNYPIKPSEMFLSADGNFFPVEDLKHRLGSLESDDKLLAASWKAHFLIDKHGKPVFANSKLNVIRRFPLIRGESMDGAIEIFEMPKKDVHGLIPANRYIAGTDPVDDDGNDDITLSLQSTFVFDTFTDRIVAEYTARTRRVEEYYEQVRRMLIFYNAKTNYEAQKKGIFGHFKNKNSLHLLAETPQILRDARLLHTGKQGNKAYGTTANEAVNRYGRDLILAWIERQAFNREENVTNLNTIRSVALLKELSAWTKDINADRVSALGMTMIYREDVIVSIQSSKKKKKGKHKAFFDKLYKQ